VRKFRSEIAGTDWFQYGFGQCEDPSRGVGQNTNSANTLYAIGVKFEQGDGVAADFGEAARCFKRAAAQGHPMAQFSLGSMFAHGRGVAKDDLQAVRWFREAALQGHPHAQCNLGNMYFKGFGAEKDWDEALEWFMLSAAQGHEKAAKAIDHITQKQVAAKAEAFVEHMNKQNEEQSCSVQYAACACV